MRTLTVAITLAAALALAGCSQETQDKAGQAADAAAADVKANADKIGEQVAPTVDSAATVAGNAIDAAANKAGDAVGHAADRVGNAAQDAGAAAKADLNGAHDTAPRASTTTTTTVVTH
ncbi:MAG: entericidin EcnAB [Croceibacterium sp.]